MKEGENMAELDLREVREKILKFMVDNGYTQKAVAQIINVDASKLNKYLSGEDNGKGAHHALTKILSRYGI